MICLASSAGERSLSVMRIGKQSRKILISLKGRMSQFQKSIIYSHQTPKMKNRCAWESRLASNFKSCIIPAWKSRRRWLIKMCRYGPRSGNDWHLSSIRKIYLCRRWMTSCKISCAISGTQSMIKQIKKTCSWAPPKTQGFSQLESRYQAYTISSLSTQRTWSTNAN